MYGAIIGDIVGSCYEFNSVKTKDFELFPEGSTFTDDTVMTVAVASALLRNRKEGVDIHKAMIQEMQYFGRQFPYAGYGGMFNRWLRSHHPKPYNSFGNGSAMRVSPCGLIAKSMEEALNLAEISAGVTHNHPYGIEGAQATVAAIYLAKTGASKEDIRAHICDNYYELNKTLDEIRPTYSFNVTCQGSVPEAIVAFLESASYTDTIRNAVSLGGDSDTQAAIAGAIAWTYYGRNGLQDDQKALLEHIHIPDLLQNVVSEFESYRQEIKGKSGPATEA